MSDATPDITIPADLLPADVSKYDAVEAMMKRMDMMQMMMQMMMDRTSAEAAK